MALSDLNLQSEVTSNSSFTLFANKHADFTNSASSFFSGSFPPSPHVMSWRVEKYAKLASILPLNTNRHGSPLVYLSIQISNATVTLGSSIKLPNLLNPETLGEVFPYGRPQAIANCQPHLVLRFCLPHWLVQQIPADLPNVLDNLSEAKRGQI